MSRAKQTAEANPYGGYAPEHVTHLKPNQPITLQESLHTICPVFEHKSFNLCTRRGTYVATPYIWNIFRHISLCV